MYRLTQMFSDTLRPMRGKILKRILTWLCCTKHNEINICHSDVHRHVSYKNDIKSINILCKNSHKHFSDTYHPTEENF